MKEQKKELLAVILIILGFTLFTILQVRCVDNWNKNHPEYQMSNNQ